MRRAAPSRAGVPGALPCPTARPLTLSPRPAAQLTQVARRVSALEEQRFLIIHATADGKGRGRAHREALAVATRSHKHSPSPFLSQQKRSISSTRQNSSHT